MLNVLFSLPSRSLHIAGEHAARFKLLAFKTKRNMMYSQYIFMLWNCANLAAIVVNTAADVIPGLLVFKLFSLFQGSYGFLICR